MKTQIITAGFLVGAICLNACSLTTPQTAIQELPSETVQPAGLIATDFVNALRQLPEMPASNTTIELSLSERSDPFTEQISEALQSAGYGTRWVNNKATANLFQYRLVAEPGAASTIRQTYEIAMGVVEMRRSYFLGDTQRVRPVGPLYVRGADASSVVLDDNLFNQSALSLATSPVRVDDAPTLDQDPLKARASARVNTMPLKPAATGKPTVGLRRSSSLSMPVEANPLNATINRSSGPQALQLPLAGLHTEQNVFDLGGSNFNDVLSEHVVVVEKVLTFANDSMRLGETNKRLVKQLVKRFNPQTDVFSVIGCSMGATAVQGGNAALALGRAGRVVEALRFAGVADRRILDEGCWAGDGRLEHLPKRGVVLTLNRKV